MSAPALAKPAGVNSDRNEITIRDLRARWQLQFDEPRVLDRLEELFTAHDASPTSETTAALMKAARHLKINPAQPHHSTCVRTLQHLTGRPVILVCPVCEHKVISTLAGQITCLACARRMLPRATQATAG